MTAATRRQPSPTSGLLIQTGTAMVWLLAHDHVPSSPPAQLSKLATPVRDRDGRLIDWKFVAPIDSTPSEHAEVMTAFPTFRQWRAGWAIERAIADAATLELFLAWADHHTDVSSLHVLHLQHGHIDARAVPRAYWQVRQLGERLDRAGNGLGLLDASTDRTIRALPCSDRAVTLLADPEVELTVRDNALELSARDDTSAREPSARREFRRLTISTGWQVGVDEAVVSTVDGPVRIGQGSALLRHISAGHEAVRLAAVPMSRLFAPVLASLADITHLAETSHLALHVRHGLAA
jgi:hypothetical protein